jgi:hypothetical protein
MLALALALAAALQAEDAVPVAETDWPWWRGAKGDGVAPAGQDPPLTWSATENVVWKADVPGRGHGSPTVFGDHVYLAACDEVKDTQSVLCYERASGRLLWETEVHRGGSMRKNAKSTGASSTAACDGERVFINFPNGGAVWTTALTREGKQLWRTKISDYVIHQGYGSSPIPHGPRLLVSADHHGGGVVGALDRKTGAFVWKRERPKVPNYTSPVVLRAAGREQLVMTGCDLVTSLDPATGKLLWEVAGATTECVTSTVTDGTHVYTSGGYPRNHLAAVKADGSGTIAWQTGDRVYVPSLLARDGHLYGVLDAGMAACWEAATGKEKWKQRLGGAFSASPVLVGDRIYATNEAGETFVYRADPAQFTQLARSRLGDEAFATPAVCGGRIYARVAERAGGRRQERLYCIGK